MPRCCDPLRSTKNRHMEATTSPSNKSVENKQWVSVSGSTKAPFRGCLGVSACPHRAWRCSAFGTAHISVERERSLSAGGAPCTTPQVRGSALPIPAGLRGAAPVRSLRWHHQGHRPGAGPKPSPAFRNFGQISRNSITVKSCSGERTPVSVPADFSVSA